MCTTRSGCLSPDPWGLPIAVLHPRTPISAHLGATSPLPQLCWCVCPQSCLWSCLLLLLTDPADPADGPWICFPRRGLFQDPDTSPQICTMCSAPMGGKARPQPALGSPAAPGSPPLREQPAPQCSWRLVFCSVLWEAKMLLITTHHRFVWAVCTAKGCSSLLEWVYWHYFQMKRKKKNPQAHGKMSSQLAWIFKTALHWNDVRYTWKVFTKIKWALNANASTSLGRAVCLYVEARPQTILFYPPERNRASGTLQSSPEEWIGHKKYNWDFRQHDF